jgi:hypothetical protein
MTVPLVPRTLTAKQVVMDLFIPYKVGFKVGIAPGKDNEYCPVIPGSSERVLIEVFDYGRLISGR